MPGYQVPDRAMVERALRKCGFSHGDVRAGALMGQDAWLLIDSDSDELARREHSGTPTLTDRALLRVLCDLPHNERIPSGSLGPTDLQILADAPPGVVAVEGTWVMRLAAPPVSVLAAAVVDDHWDRGLDRASVYAGFCPRVLTLIRKHSSEVDTLALSEAGFYGVGVVDATNPHDVNVLVDPDCSPKRFGPVSWRLREQAYAATALGAVTS